MRTDETEHPPKPDGEYVTTEMDDAQCPECGERDNIERTRAVGAVQPITPEFAGKCNDCGHTADPLAFKHEYKWSEMTDEERTEAREAQERAADLYADWQASASYISAQREP